MELGIVHVNLSSSLDLTWALFPFSQLQEPAAVVLRKFAVRRGSQR